MRTFYHETHLLLDANLNEPHFTTGNLEKIDSQDGFLGTVMGNEAAIKKRKPSKKHVSENGLDNSVKFKELEVKEEAQSNGNTSIDFHPPKHGPESIESKRERGRSSSTTQRALPTVRRHSPATHPCFEDYENHMAYQPNLPRLQKTQFICFDSIMEWRESVLDDYNTFTENSLRWGVNELKVGRIPDDQSQSLNGGASAKNLETINHYGTVFYLNIYEEEMMAACLTLVELSQPNKEKYLNISSEHDRDLILSTEQELDACFTLIGFKRERCFFTSDKRADLFGRAKKLRGFQRGFFEHTCEQHSMSNPKAKETVISDTR
ncbi:uncharacterized protein Bfra_010611 [Botrytis fragariae]|uniref:Uncharacterized protein n=1 Tax=Botrytis fragariae TaxID=1964551 RepID=A0A8H6AHX2_9HELO|nr:uncharacterized protein Bfra_010611 [Botrytis fragariae]KAF5867636.1 hypothetical protein Bfra_010611 [Botrytis fragariae]